MTEEGKTWASLTAYSYFCYKFWVEELLSRLTSIAEHAAARLKVGSALDPCLWLAMMTTPCGLVGIVFTSGVMQGVFSVLMLLPIVLFAAVYGYLAVKDPTKLRSEDYELRRAALEVIQEKGGPLQITDASVDTIVNTQNTAPTLLRKPSSEENEG